LSGQLDEWDTRAVPNGSYRIRLTVFSASGLSLQASVVVAVQNPVPRPGG
jgi:hypothetical protein